MINEKYGGDDGYKMHPNAKRPTERRDKKREGEREREKRSSKKLKIRFFLIYILR
jgi:hypothetical protein